MNVSLKSVLFSAFLYPGSGHIVLKKYPAGLTFIGFFTVLLIIVTQELIEIANVIVAKIVNGEISMDISAISQAINAHQSQELNVKVYLMIFLWAVALIDCYRISRQKTV